MSLLDDTGVSAEAPVLQRVRDGDAAAFGVLYERHLGAARRLARSLLADPSDADDAVSEVFTAAFAAMRKGRGPRDDFRPYVLTSVRRECQRAWRRGARQRPGGESVVDTASRRADERDEMESCTEDAVVHPAFASLPAQMREILWATEIDGSSHADIAARTGSTPAAVAQLASRSRRLFGERYLAAHVPPAVSGPTVGRECAKTCRVLAEVVRGTASARTRRLVDEHSSSCADCADASDHLEVVNHRLRAGHVLALLPALGMARPARVGLLARLLVWIAGAAPVITASTALVLVAAVAAPETHHSQHAASAAVVAPAADQAINPPVVVGPAPALVGGSVSTAAPATPVAPAPVTTAIVPVTVAVTVPVPVDGAATAVPPLEDVVEGVTVDDGVVPAAHGVLDALAPVDLPTVPTLGPVVADATSAVGALLPGG